jgi:hypothetical protein
LNTLMHGRRRAVVEYKVSVKCSEPGLHLSHLKAEVGGGGEWGWQERG